MPFICETQAHGLGAPLDADCSVATKVDYFYRSSAPPATQGNPGDLAAADNANGFGGGAAANPFKPLDPNAPRPADIAKTTTTEGKTVPYIVRREMGTINRAVYSIAFLHEPGTPLPIAMDRRARLERAAGLQPSAAACAAGYHQGRTIGGLTGNREQSRRRQLGDYPLAKGYALAGGSLNVFGTHCADVVSAETMMMVKEHFIERFGVPRYTIGSGRSGGSMQQHLIANNYPGLLDGIIPTASFADTMTFHDPHVRLRAARRAMTVVAAAVDRRAEDGGHRATATDDYCTTTSSATPPNLRASTAIRTTIPRPMRSTRRAIRTGVRCTYQDNMVNVYGRDPRTGFARRPFDNVGVQYGLRAFNDGKINFAQFVDLNRRVGGHDIDGNIVADAHGRRIPRRCGLRTRPVASTTRAAA